MPGRSSLDNWIKIASQFGIPAVMLAAVGYFWIKHAWPFIKQQIEDAQTARKVETDRFVDTIRARDVLMGEMQRENIKALGAITDELRSLKEVVRR